VNARPTTRIAARSTLLVLACALVSAGVLHDGALSSTAMLTDSESTTAATVQTGSVSLSMSNGASVGTWTGGVSMKPNDTVYRRLTITNSGATRLRYAITATSSSALSAKLVMNVAVIAASSSCSSSTYSAGTVVSGTDLVFGSSGDLNVVGDPATGAQDGDRVLDALASDNLCMKLTFPTGTHLGYAGRGATASTVFTVSGENA
jgi:hypothetical protein